MKLVSAAIVVAILCASVAYGAPYAENEATPNLSFDELTRKNPIAIIGDKIKEYWANAQCIHDVIDEVVGQSDLKALWMETAVQVEALAKEWMKCTEISEQTAQNQCKLAVTEKAIELMGKLVTQLINKSRWEMIKEIRQKVAAQCFKKPNQNVFSEESDESVQMSSIPEQFQCMVDALGTVSKRNGLEELWSKAQPQLQQHLDKWKQCPNAGNKLLVILCNVKEGLASYKLITDYIRVVAAEKPQVVNEWVQEVQQNCVSKQLYDADFVKDDLIEAEAFFGANEENEYPQKGIEKIKCIAAAIDDAVKETNYQSIWNSSKQELEVLYGRVKACQNLPNKWEVAKCVGKEAHVGYGVVNKFVANLKQANHKTYERAMKYVQERCYPN